MTEGLASSYGDTADMNAYQNALVAFLRAGRNQQEAEAGARKVGDPGIGWCDNVLSDRSVPWVALPYEDWQGRFRTKAEAHKAKVLVTINGKTVICQLGDTMPHKAELARKAKEANRKPAVIDLAPGAQAAFNLKPPFLVPVSWEWV